MFEMTQVTMQDPEPPCLSGRCDACVAIKPLDVIMLKAGASWGAEKCGSMEDCQWMT